MNNVFIVYKTDVWHSYASRDTIGIATTETKAWKLCHQAAKQEHKEITGDALFELVNLKQTQSYEGEGEFVIEEMELNTLL